MTKTKYSEIKLLSCKTVEHKSNIEFSVVNQGLLSKKLMTSDLRYDTATYGAGARLHRHLFKRFTLRP
jgi:hypothetical protein